MAEEVTKLKNVRRTKLAGFTRKSKSLLSLLDNAWVSTEKLEEVLGELKAAFRALEVAHERYSSVANEAELEAEGDYLEESSISLDDLDLKVASKIKSLETVEKFGSAKLKIEHGIDSFGTPSKVITDLSTAREISFADMRTELNKIEASHNEISREFLNLDPAVDHKALRDSFKTKVADEFDRCKMIGLRYLKDVPAPATESTSRDGGGTGAVRLPGYSATKRETVMLPAFSGDEKTAFLQYPIWKKQWSSHISEYEVKYRATMLLNHLDAKAKEQIVGFENEYEQAMDKLEKYYNDAKKIIKACLDEIRSQPNITAFDYKALVNYKKILVNNYTRLKACGLDHEMSNTAAMGVLVRKFPLQEAVKWQEFLAEQTKECQAKPFPSFMLWLEKAGSSWELLASSGTGVKGKGGSAQVHHSFYGDETDSKQDKSCFKCGQSGHWKRNCPQSSPKGQNQNSNTG